MSDPAYPPQPMAQWRPGQGPAPQWDNMPSQPPPENNGGGPPVIGPPPGFQPMAMPPPPPPPPRSGEPPLMTFARTEPPTEQACREAFLHYAAQNCCWSKAPAEEHVIEKCTPSNALHYTLESFCESRSTAPDHEPFTGQPVDGPFNGQPPPPWMIPCNPNALFQNHTKHIEVPHTAQVQGCHGCDSRGFNRCWKCHGCGHNQCGSCHGSGRTSYMDADGNHLERRCGSCGGDGRRRCGICGGDGRITCKTCQGHRQLKCFIKLSVTFINHLEDHIIEQTDMPDELVRDVKGDVIFEQSLPQVWPIIAFPIQEINQNSMKLVDKHSKNWPNERMLHQRQVLRSIMVTEVAYKWEENNLRYWVYGQENRVYCPDYPKQCCCTIL